MDKKIIRLYHLDNYKTDKGYFYLRRSSDGRGDFHLDKIKVENHVEIRPLQGRIKTTIIGVKLATHGKPYTITPRQCYFKGLHFA